MFDIGVFLQRSRRRLAAFFSCGKLAIDDLDVSAQVARQLSLGLQLLGDDAAHLLLTANVCGVIPRRVADPVNEFGKLKTRLAASFFECDEVLRSKAVWPEKV